MHKTILALALQVALCATVYSQQQYYSVKFPDDRTIIGCGATADTSDVPIIDYWGNCGFNVGITVKDQVFSLNATGGCKKILRTWKLIWWCDYDPNWPGPTNVPNPTSTDVGATVIGDSNNHGYLQYVQIIKVIDNDPPVFVNCPAAPVLFCDYTNNDLSQYGNRCEGPVNLNVKVTDVCSATDITLTYRLYLDLDGNGSMETFRTSSAPDAWPIEKTVSGDTVMGKIVLPTGVGLPYGTHKVEWIAADGCGNQSICKYEFVVKDCKAPTIVCLNGLSVNIMPTGMISIWATDFLQYMSDNCTPNDLLKVGIRKAGTGTGFPFETGVTFDCNELGQQFVEIWVIDAYGNADFCQTYVTVQDHFGACVPNGTVSGNILNDQHQALKGAKVTLKSNNLPVPQQFNAVTNAQGKYLFPNAPGTCNYSITPQLDTLPGLGVNTLDVLLSDWHISGQELLPTPYKIVAADANHDNLLNAADLDAMGNLIIGASNSFPNNTSWRFIPAAYTFPTPLNPLSTAFPEKISTMCPAISGDNQHFIAIKTGDVDGSADLSSFSGASDDRSAEGEKVMFNIPNRRYVAGEEVTATLMAPDLSTMLGFQFTLFANPNLLSLESVEPMLTERIGTYIDQNSVAASWYTRAGEDSGVRPVMVLKFKAVNNGSLKQAIQFNSNITKAEAYNPDRKTIEVGLQFVQPVPQVNQAKLMPVSPNPTSGAVKAEFFLPEAASVTLTLSDLNGSAVAQQTANYEAGWHKVEVPNTAQVSGIYFLRLQSDKGSETQRVMLQR